MEDDFFLPIEATLQAESLPLDQADELQQLYDLAPCGYHSLDENGVFIRINQTELEMLGYDRDELIGKKRFSDLLTPASQRIFRENFSRFKQQGWIKNLEFEIVRRDKSILHISLSSTAIVDAAGDYQYSRSVVIDISDRVKLETDRQLVEARLRYVLATTPVVLYTCQATGDFGATFISDNLREILGYESQQFLADSNFWASHIHPDDAPMVFAGLTHLFEQGVHSHEYRFYIRMATTFGYSMNCA